MNGWGDFDDQCIVFFNLLIYFNKASSTTKPAPQMDDEAQFAQLRPLTRGAAISQTHLIQQQRGSLQSQTRCQGPL